MLEKMLENETISEQLALEMLAAEVGLLDQDTESGEDPVADGGISLLLATTDRELKQARSVGDERQVRILEKTKRWLALLERQSAKLTSVAEDLYDRCVRAHALDSAECGRVETIEQLEWTIAGLEHSLEALRPEKAPPRLHIKWDGDDGLCWWEGEEPMDLTLFTIVLDVAETEGGFEAVSAERVAQAITHDLRTGDLELLRVSRLTGTSPDGEVVFELIPRGIHAESNDDSDLTTIAFEEGNWVDIIPVRVEALLGHQKAANLARLVDNSLCEVERERYTAARNQVMCADPSGVQWLYRRPASNHTETMTRLIDLATAGTGMPESAVVGVLAYTACQRLRASHISHNPTVFAACLNALEELMPYMIRRL